MKLLLLPKSSGPHLTTSGNIAPHYYLLFWICTIQAVQFMLEDRISPTSLERRSNPSHPQESDQIKSHPTKSFQTDCLTPYVGKVFSSFLKHRWLSFMVGNGYIDKNIQKASMPGVPGCIEQSTKLAAALHDAHIKHRSITVCWLYLAST